MKILGNNSYLLGDGVVGLEVVGLEMVVGLEVVGQALVLQAR